MSLPSKDNLTNASSTNQIDWYFELKNPEAKKRHLIFFGFGIMNILFILIYIFEFAAGLAFFVWVGIIAALIGVSIYLVLRKNSYYRFLIYLSVFGGLYCNAMFFIMYPGLLLTIIASVIFLVNYVSIELSLYRFQKLNKTWTKLDFNKLEGSTGS